MNPPISTHTLTKDLPPDWSICVGNPYAMSCMGTMHPLVHIMEVQLLTWIEPAPEPPELLLTMTMPLEIKHLSKMISEAYVDILSSIPHIMSDRLPNLNPNLTPISFLVWNVQGARSQAFLAALREILKVNNPTVVSLMETHMESDQANLIAFKFNFERHMPVDAQGFSGGI